MNRKSLLFVLLVSGAFLALTLSVPRIASKELTSRKLALKKPGTTRLSQAETAFSYQGYLTVGESPADGSFDFAFELYDALSGGIGVGSALTLDDVVVSEGQFTVQLDLGDVFDGTPLWLQISVSPDRGAEAYSVLTPRQALRPAPSALFAAKSDWSGLSGVPADLADGDDDTLAALGCSSNQMALWNGSSWLCADLKDDTLQGLDCSSGQVAKWNAPPGQWMCSDDNDTLASLSCTSGQIPQWNDSAWSCDVDDDTLAQITCSDGQIIERSGSGWVCGQDDVGAGGGGGDITGVYSGVGLTGGGPSGEVTLTVAFEGDGSAATVARSDHGHDASYYTENELQSGTASVHWGNLTDVPNGINDGDDDTLADLGCANGQVPQWNGSAWVCDPDDDGLGSLECAGGQLPRWNGSAWICSEETGDGDTLAALSCADGQVPQWNGSIWACAADDDTLAQITCSDGQIIERFGDGWICGQDDVGAGGGGGDITGVYSGDGLAGGGPSGEITLTVAFDGDGSAATVAHSDHAHDTVYYTESELQSGSASVHWGNLSNIPNGINDGDDDSLGALSCASGEIPRWNGSAWICSEETGDGDTLAGLVCAIGEVAQWNGSDWLCNPDVDSLGALTCEEGAVAKFDQFGGEWFCATDLDTVDDDVSFDEIAPIVGSWAGTVASGDHDHAGLYADSFHNHDTEYYTIDALQSSGGAPVNWGNLFDIPSGLDDGDDDTLAGLICPEGEIARWIGGVWDCSVDFDALGYLPCTNGQIPQWNGLNWVCADYAAGWSLSGNGGTIPGANFLGTTDGVSLTLAVSGTAALRLEPTTWSPNLIGGHTSNSVRGGVYGATIGGGASSIEPHRISDHFGVVGGGTDNLVGTDDSDLSDARYGTVGGGAQNTASSVGATVGGGGGNTASNAYAIVSGGYVNLASGYMSAVGGGSSNIASHFQSTVAGGLSNQAFGNQSTIGGGEGNRIITATQRATIAGGSFNIISGTYATVGGGTSNVISGTYGTIAGGSSNIITGSYGTISGGGPSRPDLPTLDTRNKVSDDYGVVGGGGSNHAGNNNADLEDSEYATVGGGLGNWSWGYYSTVGGGASNSAAGASTIGGGVNNATHNEADTIGGGWANDTRGSFATIGGGANNQISGTYGTIAGGNEGRLYAERGTIGGGVENQIAGDYGTIGGGLTNIITGSYGTIAGGGPSKPGDYTLDTRNKVSDDYGVVGGGGFNQAGNNNVDLEDSEYATVSGGLGNWAWGYYSTVGGGASNSAAGASTIGGGVNNATHNEADTVGGGWANDVRGSFGTIGGGANNQISGTYGTIAGGNEGRLYAKRGTIGGGVENQIAGDYGTIGGGYNNMITGTYGTISGGGPSEPTNYTIDTRNRVSDDYGTIGGGGNNFAGDGDGIITNTLYTTVGGGYGNVASGDYATVPGGNLNTAAGTSSFAAGSRAKANHNGSFVWADTIDSSFVTSDRPDQFKVRAWGGSKFEDGYGLWVEMNFTDLINTSSGTYLDIYGVWHSTSDRAVKENFRQVDGQQILDSLADMPITSWNYKTDDNEARHIGPMAQDLYAAFGLGDSTTTIGTVDADGISMVAIQALYERSQDLETENSVLRRELTDLEARMNYLERVDSGPQSSSLVWGLLLAVALLFMGSVTWVLWRTGLLQAAVARNSGGGR